MTKLEEDIKELKAQGYSYNRITETLGCAKSTVSYYLGKGQKDKSKIRMAKTKYQDKAKTQMIRRRKVEFAFRYKRLCGCKICKEKDPIVLDFDHKDGVNKLGNLCEMINNSYSMKTIKAEIRKCDVLCANCHRRRTAKQFNHFADLI